MSGRVLRLPRFGGDSRRADGASVEAGEESIRQRLYGERRMVQLLAPGRSLGVVAERGDGPERGANEERPPSATGAAVVPVPRSR